MEKRIGILTAGGDCPGSNAVLRGFGKAARTLNMQVIGFQDGFTGMVNDDVVDLSGEVLSGIITHGGTILGTSRERPTELCTQNQKVDRTADIVAVYQKHELDALACLGGMDAQISAAHLHKAGLNVVTLPLTIDNDLVGTDASIGFDSAVETAAEAIDRLHSTAYSHHRIMIVEAMGRESGWLTLAAGLAGGADVILIPEIPYDEQKIASAIMERRKAGKRFSIVAVSEGALSDEYHNFFEQARLLNQRKRSGEDQQRVASRLARIEHQAVGNTIHLANLLERYTDLDTRITILGYLQRGGSPSAVDRVLATELSTACVDVIQAGQFGVMVGKTGTQICTIALEDVIQMRKKVPLDHSWLRSARQVGTCLGD